MENTDKLSTLLSESLEKKRVEVISARGAVDASRELQRLQANFVEKAKGELKSLVTEGKVSQDIANFVISWIGKSAKVVEDFSAAAKTNLDTKSGETISLGNVMQLLKQIQTPPSVPTPDVAEISPPPPPPIKEDKRSYKSRLKKNKLMANTVERVKKSRKKDSEGQDNQ